LLNTDGQYRLVFCSNTDIQLDLFSRALAKDGFIGEAIFDSATDSVATEYCVGDTFLSSITFMGCSPYIEFEPPVTLQESDSADFCFIRISKTKQRNVMYHAEQLESLKTVPRCKQCRKVISNWQEQAERLNKNWQLHCPQCDSDINPDELDWRKASGLGNVFMEVMNVYLQEAIPTEAFMKQLEAVTSTKWSYFYTDKNIKTKFLDSV